RVLPAEAGANMMTDPESLHELDVLSLDQRMPHTSGLALLAGLRRRVAAALGTQGTAGGVPAVILISAFLSHELRVEAARLGVVEVIEKPIDTAHLLASVRAALSGAACPRPVDPLIPR